MSESSQSINVLELGVKNDGSEDISTIVNQATAEHALFFPAGLYKVSKPLCLRNPIRGEGYSRLPGVTPAHTWFLSELEDESGETAVITCAPDQSQRPALNVENLSIRCHSGECGIRLAADALLPYVLVDKVGIFNVKSYGVYCNGRGSRPSFLQNMTIFSSKDYPVPGVGIYIARHFDNRLSNIEVMGCRISLWLCDGFNYGSNLHLWTGAMSGQDNGQWWKGTRGIVLENHSTFNASQVYPDTSFYALEARGAGCAYHLDNIFYWEDDSTKGSHDHDGAFYHSESPDNICHIDGGEIAVMPVSENNGRMAQVRIDGQPVKNVVIRSNIPLAAENLDKLCAGDELPDYSLSYTAKGYCRMADFLAAEDGCAQALLYLNNGALYQLDFSMDGAEPELKATPLNRRCQQWPLHIVDKGQGVLAVYVYNDGATALSARLSTRFMGPRCRPLNYGQLRSQGNLERCKEILEVLPETK